MTDRNRRRPTQVETSSPVPDELRTQEVEIVMPEFGNTITELGSSAIDVALGSDQRAMLVLVAGAMPGQVYALKDEATIIGRDPLADIQIEDSAVSRRHSRIVVGPSSHVVEDLGSANGTFVQGVKVTRRELENGDRIQLGPRVVFRFALLDEAEEAMHRQLFESSTRDPLTAAYNKKYITERLAAEVAYAVRHNSALEVVMFDLDKFKHVNDQHGHLVGDAVLRAVSDRVRSVIRSEDVFGRFGGEEFVVVSRGSDAAMLAERIRSALEELAIQIEGGILHVTVSLGVARANELQTLTATRLLELADLRLLEAKRSGRNQVCSR